MTGKMKRLMSRYLLGLCLSVCPAAVFALGLGEIHLHSALNQPLSAEVELLGATADELRSLNAGMASRETFARYGIEPSRLHSSLRFTVGRDGTGRDVLKITSTEAINDPFLTLLVEVSWARGRLLREYTMLLDPPVYMPGEQGSSAPVAAPRSEPAATQRPAERPAAAAPPASAPAPATSQPMAPSGAFSYTVQRNDTLWQIASQHTSGSPREINRMMVALYRANPEAFNRNINELHAGAILRIPAGSEMDAIGSGEAVAEVRRQYAEWRESRGETAAQTADESARLRLVAPSASGEGAAAAPAGSEALNEKVRTLEQQLAESRRMLDLKNAELARLQERLGETSQQPPPQTLPELQGETPAEAPAPSGVDTAVEQAEGEAQAQPVEQAPPVAESEAPAESTPTSETGASILDWLIQNWYFAVGGLLLLGLVIFGFLRRRDAPDFEALGRLAQAEEDDEHAEPSIGEASTSSTARLRTIKREENFLVEESGEHPQVEDSPASRKPQTVPASDFLSSSAPADKTADDTLSSETAINLDQGDPLAEADFHMAYGLYDQAADLVSMAIERQPDRRDLKLKLLEIYFVWGNKDSFLESARQLQDGSQQAPGEWDKIVIMGKQIAPEDPLFAQAGGGAPSSEVDLDLQGGDHRLDLDILEGGNDSVDLDFGEAGPSKSTETTGEVADLKGSSGIDFVFDEDAAKPDTSATTREMAARTMETPTVEMEAVSEADAGEDTGTGPGDVPTVESPALRDKASSTIKEKIDSAQFRPSVHSSDQTAELAIDDLGLDVDALGGDSAELEALEETDHPADAATMLAGLDETSRRTLEEAGMERQAQDDEDATQAATRVSPEQSPTTGTWILDEDDQAATMTSPDVGGNDATTRVPSPGKKSDNDATAELKTVGGETMDMDLDNFEAALASDTAKHPQRGASAEDRFSSDVFSGSKDLTDTDIDLDVSEARRNHDQDQTQTERISAEDMDLPELEPVTMSEVGTKLDLARAYMDMGDPEGARNILDEVLQEGSATQKQEAQRLIDSLPG